MAKRDLKAGERLDGIFSFDVSSGRSYEELTAAIAPLSRGEQDFVLHWATVAARTSSRGWSRSMARAATT